VSDSISEFGRQHFTELCARVCFIRRADGHTAELHLVSPSRARIAFESHYVGDIRAINAEVLDAYQLKSLDTFIDADLGGAANGLGKTRGNQAHFVRRADGKVIIKWSSATKQTDPSLAAYAKKTNVEDDHRRQPEYVCCHGNIL
jgi:hypothetical protein